MTTTAARGVGPEEPSFYEDSPARVRDDLEEAHRRVWQRMASPGSWFTGAERVAIADETRRARECAVCKERKEALSPFAVDGEHESAGVLPDVVADVAHRVSTDPGRLTRNWFDQAAAAGLEDDRYVETVAVVSTTVGVDMFCRAIGVPLRPLPDPVDGRPTGNRPAGAKDEGCWVATLPNGNELYQGTSLPYVVRAFSLVPDEVRGIIDLLRVQYVTVDKVMDPAHEPGRAISRAQMELIAARVSAVHDCFY
jgi:hypothetical protein